MYKIFTVFSLLFFIFILWIIYLADTGQNSRFFELIHGVPFGDKIGHFILYGVLTFGVVVATRFRVRKIASFTIFSGALYVTVFAVVEEVSQQFFAIRTLDGVDLFADGLGICLFSGLSYLLKQRMSFQNGKINTGAENSN